MRRSRTVIAVFLLGASIAAGIPAGAARPPDPRERLIEYLQKTRGLFLDSVDCLTEEQWNYRTAPDRWSIAEIAQHVTIAEILLRDAVVRILDEPAPPGIADGTFRKEDEVMKLIIDRSERFNAPPELRPANQWKTPEETLAEFRRQREETLKLARAQNDLRGHGADHPIVGSLDAYGWLVFLSGHTERHTLQIREVMTDPRFPRPASP